MRACSGPHNNCRMRDKIRTKAFSRTGVMKGNAHSFTYSEIERRFNACLGHTLGQIDSSDVFGRYARKNKGVAGSVVEQSVLGYPADSAQEPDLEVDGIDVELKVTGLKRTNRGEVVAKEPMSITAVSIESIVDEEFDSSTLWHKLKHLLVFYYLYEPKLALEHNATDSGWQTVPTPTGSYAEFEVMGWNLHVWTEEDRRVIQTDWELVRDYVRKVMGEHEDEESRSALWPLISTKLNPQMMFLGTAPKYPHPPRFRLKNSVVTTMWRIAEGKAYERLEDGPSTFAELDARCHDLEAKYAGMTVELIARDLGYDGSLASKQVAEALVVRMFGGKAAKMSKVEVFAMSSLSCKTLVLSSKGRRTEDMKLFRVDLDELQDPEASWGESSFSAYFSEMQLLCPVFQEPHDAPEFKDNVFRGFERLAFPEGFVGEEARKTWEDCRALILEDRLVDVVRRKKDGTPKVNRKGNIESAPNWPKSKTNIVFLRGTGSDSDDKTEVVNGVRMYKQYVWVKGAWIVNQLPKNKYF